MTAPMCTPFMASVVLLLAMTAGAQAGEREPKQTLPSSEPRSMACDPVKDQHCGPGDTPVRRPAVEPAVPPVPNSPLRVDCERLPTQLERDTCTNRKQSTS
jgi:hypothetical protein